MPIIAAQWNNVVLNLLGLRSGATPTDINFPASYAMDCGVPAPPIPEIPKNWDDLLAKTIYTMKGFSDANQRYLLIVSESTGGENEYFDCFPSCKAKPSFVSASTPLNADKDNLVEWVLANI